MESTLLIVGVLSLVIALVIILSIVHISAKCDELCRQLQNLTALLEAMAQTQGVIITKK